MPHTHTIDGKVISFDDKDCQICHPEQQGQPEQKEKEVLPRVYRKGETVVLKISKMTNATLTWWPEGKLYLMTVQRMLTDADGKIVFGSDNNPVWTKLTIRLTNVLLQNFLHEASTLYSEIENQKTVPRRD
jgi:hypothetical protein